jgi:uncharacterized membrane protein YeaQ/YmgE (transglycosylase-associated protein family)
MIENQKIRPAQVIGPLGEPLTLDTLPPPSTTRWVVRRKAEVVAAVNGGLLSVDEACDRYSLTVEEFAGWQRAVDRSGMPGLRVTRIQHYKSLYERQQKWGRKTRRSAEHRSVLARRENLPAGFFMCPGRIANHAARRTNRNQNVSSAYQHSERADRHSAGANGQEEDMGLILWLIVGGVVGWLASMVMRTDAQQGIILNIVVGIVGAFIGGLLFGGSINQALTVYTFLTSLLGAIILLAIVNLVRRGAVR